MNQYAFIITMALLAPVCGFASVESSSRDYVDSIKMEIVHVPMRDGVKLAARIMRPNVADNKKVPAVMVYNPYRAVKPIGDDYRLEGRKYASYLAEHGYAVVQFDVRGTGNSGGWSTDVYSDDERQDGYDMVEWIAEQPWSNGNVGMIGISYAAVVQWQVAVQNPPSLKAIIVRSANDSVYTEWVYPGGSLRPYMYDSYSPFMTALNFSPPDPEVVGARWREIWDERLENSRPWGLAYINHQTEDSYWLDRSLSADYSRVKAATLVIGAWADAYPTALLRAFSKLEAPKRALIGPWGHRYPEEDDAIPGPRIDGRPIYLEWFDYWLKGIENGVMDKPPVTLFVRKYNPPSSYMPIEEPGFWRWENDWPIPRAENAPFYFHPDGHLSPERYRETQTVNHKLEYRPSVGVTSGMHWGGGFFAWGNPIDQKLDEAYSLLYTTPPLETDVEVTGNPKVVLHASSTADVAYFRVKLIDVAPDGTSKLVRYGGLNATHRNGHSSPEPLIPGQLYELEIDVKAMSYIFEKGHRIRVAISNADIQNAWPTAKKAVNTVRIGRRTPSHIILPIVPPQKEDLGEPDVVSLPHADPAVALDAKRPIRYSIEYDLLDDTTTVHMGSSNKGIHPGTKRGPDGREESESESRFTVSNTDPATASLKASYTRTIIRPDSIIEVKADEVTISDDSKFRHTSTVDISINGEPFFNKSWSKTVPRELN